MVAARVTTGLAGRVARACIAALFRDKSLPMPRSRYTPRQNSPSTSTGGHPPRKYSPSTAKTLRFGLFSARWAKNVAFATRALPAGRIFSRRPQPTSRAGYPHRYKTLPAHGVHELNRYKTLPASRKTPISALLTRAGRKLSRSGRKLPEQGELFPADHHPLAAQRTPTVQNSPSTRYAWPQPAQNSPSTRRTRPQPVQNSPRTRYAWPQPVQNSPSIAKNAHFSPFEASREKIIPVEMQTTDAGRVLSRSGGSASSPQ